MFQTESTESVDSTPNSAFLIDIDDVSIESATNDCQASPKIPQSSSLNALKLLLNCDDYSAAVYVADNSASTDEDDMAGISGIHPPADLAEMESDLSSENGPLPPYLDTITEEDTDDLMSISSGRFVFKLFFTFSILNK